MRFGDPGKPGMLMYPDRNVYVTSHLCDCCEGRNPKARPDGSQLCDSCFEQLQDQG